MFAYYGTMLVMPKWATVTVIDAAGRRHSMDVQADSSYDACHLYLTSAKSQEAALLPARCPIPTMKTVFEVTVEGKVYHVTGAALQKWIQKNRDELKGPKGVLFRQRATL